MEINQIQIVRPVYDKLLDTFLGKPDKAWWNDIVLRQAKVGDGDDGGDSDDDNGKARHSLPGGMISFVASGQGCSLHENDKCCCCYRLLLILLLIAKWKQNSLVLPFLSPGGTSLHKTEKGCREVRVG